MPSSNSALVSTKVVGLGRVGNEIRHGTAAGSETIKSSPRARELLNENSTAELKFWIDSTDRWAVNAPNGSGIGKGHSPSLVALWLSM